MTSPDLECRKLLILVFEMFTFKLLSGRHLAPNISLFTYSFIFGHFAHRWIVTVTRFALNIIEK